MINNLIIYATHNVSSYIIHKQNETIENVSALKLIINFAII